MTRKQALEDFFQTVLKGESKTYNDHNWYDSSGLRGYIEGQNKVFYPLLQKPLSQYTVGEIKAMQTRGRSQQGGQLWATGRYQIIPSTLKDVAKKAGIADSALYNEATQDALGYQLLLDRKPIRDYLSGAVPDTTQTLQAAALSMSQVWSSIGVPYPIPSRGVGANQSYYSSDKASVSSEAIQAKLRQLRQGAGKVIAKSVATTVDKAQKNPWLTVGLTLVVVLSSYLVYTQFKKK